MGIDAVGGDLPNKVLNAMPLNSHLIIYGALSGYSVGNIEIGNFIFDEKVVEGLWLSPRFNKLSPNERQQIAKRVLKQLNDTFKSEIEQVIPIEQWDKAIEHHQKSRSKGKILLKLS